MTKKEFLVELEKELSESRIKEIAAIVSYYDELIEDQIESGTKEKDVIKNLGKMSDIIENIKTEVQTEKNKPTLSNGFKAVIAVLSILSLPMLIPLGILIFAMMITIGALIFSFILTLGAAVISAFAIMISVFVMFIQGKIPFVSFIFGIGVCFLLAGLIIYTIKYTMIFSKWFLGVIIKKLNQIANKKDGRKINE